jgi:hypothetical protein
VVLPQVPENERQSKSIIKNIPENVKNLL